MKIEVWKILAVGTGGFIGAIGRYLLSLFAQHRFEETVFPYGTILSNLVGCLLIGFLAGLFESRGWVHPELRLFLFVGLLGGFTTFSTFAHESFLLWENTRLILGLLNIGIQVLAGLLLVWTGYQLVRLIS